MTISYYYPHDRQDLVFLPLWSTHLTKTGMLELVIHVTLSGYAEDERAGGCAGTAGKHAGESGVEVSKVSLFGYHGRPGMHVLGTSRSCGPGQEGIR